MLVKVFKHGTGAGYGPVHYVTSTAPFGKEERHIAPYIIKGDPHLMIRQIDTVPFKWKYSSGVISFAPDDKPTKEQLNALIEEFEELAFAGLPLSSRSILWVQHSHVGRTELHFIIPRQEPHTRKSFNAFPPGWQKRFDVLRDKYNYQYGWARPDDPARVRDWQPEHHAYAKATVEKKGIPHPESLGEKLTNHLIQCIETGTIQDRQGVIQELKSLGYALPRIGKDYLTVLDKNTGKRTRLKGNLYTADFNVIDWQEKKKQPPLDNPNSVKAQQADEALQRIITTTRKYNLNRYLLQETYYEQPKQQPASGREQPGITGREKISAQEWRDDARNRISTLGEGIQGRLYTGSAFATNGECQNKLRGEVFGSRKSAKISPKRKSSITSPVQESETATQLLYNMGGSEERGYGVETLHREGLARSTRRADDNITEHSRSSGGDFERRDIRARGDDESCYGHLERNPREGTSFRSITKTKVACKGYAEKIIGQLPLVYEKGIFNVLNPHLERLSAPNLQLLRHLAESIIYTAPQLFEYAVFKNISKIQEALLLPNLTPQKELAENVVANIPIVYDAVFTRSFANTLLQLTPPNFMSLHPLSQQIIRKSKTVNDQKILGKIVAAEEIRKARQTINKLARWAGENLERWDEVEQYIQDKPFLKDTFEQQFQMAHTKFIDPIHHLTASRKLDELVPQCRKNPYLMREYTLLINYAQSKSIEEANLAERQESLMKP